jgi:hypothetical protein
MMGRVWQFARRHWGWCLTIFSVGVAVARPDLLQSAAERVLQGVLSAIAILLGAAMTAIVNTVARNGHFFEQLFMLAIVIFAMRIMFRGIFRKSSRK